MSKRKKTTHKKPNVIFVMTDDQGYGDLSCYGNPYIRTPHIDKLAKQGVQFRNYHSNTLCTPTRAGILTGFHSAKVDILHTTQGRSLLRSNVPTIADIFTQNGYATGMIGKWHLGDCYPFRPEDRGFQHVVYHGGGGVGQTPDYWGNDYFDDTYIVNGEHQQFEGFCTDVWFDEAISFIKKSVKDDKPFFAYLSPNAPHGPYYCPEKYAKRFEGMKGSPNPAFCGMVENIDDNMGKLMAFLKESGLEENTVLIFTTDNGTAGGVKFENKHGYNVVQGFNAGMRGRKGCSYDGGHRVPFIIQWPAGNLKPKSIDKLTTYLDVFPTFIDLLGLEAPEFALEGKSWKELLYTSGDQWPNRTMLIDTQDGMDYTKYGRASVVMTDRWRLVQGNELYDIIIDPDQRNDVAAKYPEIVKQLSHKYEKYWQQLTDEPYKTGSISIGSNESPIVALTSFDWSVVGCPWNQPQITHGDEAKEAFWEIEVETEGEYEISMRRWPVEADVAINAANGFKGFNFTKAVLRIADIVEEKEITDLTKEVTFRVRLKKGRTQLSPVFVEGDLKATPYYVYVTHKPFDGWQTSNGMGLPVYNSSYGRMPPQMREQFK